MTDAIQTVLTMISTMGLMVLGGIGFIDYQLHRLMSFIGIGADNQLIVLALTAFVLFVLAVRYLGGILAWLVLILLVLLLAQDLVPAWHSAPRLVPPALQNSI